MLGRTTFNLSRLSTFVRPSTRWSSTTSLKDRITELLPEKQEQLNKLKKEHGEKIVHKVTVNQLIGGARSVKCMLWETSLLDPVEGIRFRNYTIPELQQRLPTAPGGQEPLPEGLLWLLMTGDIPTYEQAHSVTEELHARSHLPEHIESTIRNFPKHMHPMTQLASAVLSLQTDSVFAKAYRDGVSKKEYWVYTLEDTLNLLARLPRVAALIYRNTFHDGNIADYDMSTDYGANYSRMLGFNNSKFDELMRLYLVIHSDHEGGNASAHTTHLVGSTLSDPYLSFAGGMTALAGPLHGLANQEVLRWTLDLQQEFESKGKEVNEDTIRDFAWATLNAGKVIPGYGHAVLRQTDPRYTAQREFALKHLPDDPLFKIVSTVYKVVPDVLTEHGKTANPWPNVDAHSGALLWHYGMREFDYYTVMFGVSRAMGVLSQLLWDRALGLPLERPKSVTPEWLINTDNYKNLN